MAVLLYPENGFLFDTHTELQNEFIRRIADCGITEALKWLEPVKNRQEVSQPSVLTFRWENILAHVPIFAVGTGRVR